MAFSLIFYKFVCWQEKVLLKNMVYYDIACCSEWKNNYGDIYDDGGVGDTAHWEST